MRRYGAPTCWSLGPVGGAGAELPRDDRAGGPGGPGGRAGGQDARPWPVFGADGVTLNDGPAFGPGPARDLQTTQRPPAADEGHAEQPGDARAPPQEPDRGADQGAGHEPEQGR